MVCTPRDQFARHLADDQEKDTWIDDWYAACGEKQPEDEESKEDEE